MTKQTKKLLSGIPPDQKPIGTRKGVWAITEHPHPPTNPSPFAESKWSFADQLLNLRGGMVSSIHDIFKLNKFMHAAKQRMNRLRKDTTVNTKNIGAVKRDVGVLKDCRITAHKQITEIIGARPISPLGTKDLTTITEILANQRKLNNEQEARIARLESILHYIGFTAALVLFIFIIKLFVENY